MARRDGSGPTDHGPRTDNSDSEIPGRGFGMGYGRGHCFRGGMGMGRRAGWGGSFVQPTPQEERCFLENQMEALQNRLNFVKQRLEGLSPQETQES